MTGNLINSLHSKLKRHVAALFIKCIKIRTCKTFYCQNIFRKVVYRGFFDGIIKGKMAEIWVRTNSLFL